MHNHFLAFVIVSGLTAGEPCIPVTGEWITAKDLGRIDSAFLAQDGDTQLLRSPRFGAQRHVTASELKGLAARFNASSGNLLGACFEQAHALLGEDQIQAALRNALTGIDFFRSVQSSARIEILEWPREPLPLGTLSFDLRRRRAAGSSQASDAGDWIYGELKYQAARKLPLWLRVRIRSAEEMVTAASDMQKGEVLRREHLQLQNRELDLLTAYRTLRQSGITPSEAIGNKLAKDLPAGTVLAKDHFEPPARVRRGESVTLQVISGSARVYMPATAESNGMQGERITLRIANRSNRLVAEVTGSGSAQIHVKAPLEIANETSK